MELSELQKKIVNAPENKIVVMAAAAAGKALENGSILYTDHGPIKIEDSKIGDLVYGLDGQLRTIIGVFPQGLKKKYIVEFSDGTKINCCNEHLWTFQTESLRGRKSKTWVTTTLDDIINNYPLFKDARAKNNFSSKQSKRKNIWIPMTQPINFPSRKVPLDAYTLGALLGDGCLNGAGAMSTFTNADKDVLEKVQNGLQQIGCSLQSVNNQNRPYDYKIRQNSKIGNGKGVFTSLLEDLNLDFSRSGDKFIPDLYKYNSIQIRIDLLKGIIDTDGYCEGGAYDIVLKSQKLILDIKEVCESLGMTAVYSTKKAICTNSTNGKKDCGEVYRLRIKTTQLIQKIHSSQKRESQWRPTKVYAHRAITKITETNEYVPMTCIQVDSSDELFVTNNFIVTHNTQVLTERARKLLREGVEPTDIAVITFTNLAAQELKERLAEDYKDGIYIGTIHGLANKFLVTHGINTGKLIEKEEFDEFFELLQENPHCVKHIPNILLDEAQDSSWGEFNFIFNMIKPDTFFVAADPRQSIYGFRDAQPELIKRLARQPDVTVYDLNENYRNGELILEYAKRILEKIGMSDSSIPMRTGGMVYEGTCDLENIIQWIKKYGTYRDWAILCSTNNEIDWLRAKLKERDIPTITFKQGKMTKAQLENAMKDNVVKVLTRHSAKGLEFPYVIVYNPSWWGGDEAKRVNYVAATRARDILLWLEPKKTPTRKRKKYF